MSSSSKPQLVSISMGTILKTIGILIALAVLWAIRDILLYLFVAFLLAGVMYPFAHYAARHRIPKGVAVFFFYILSFGIAGLSVGLLVPAVRTQGYAFFQLHGDWISNYLPAGVANVFQNPLQSAPAILSNLDSVWSQIQQSSEAVMTALGSVFGGVAAVVVVLVLAFYIVVEESAVKNVFKNIIPDEHQEMASQIILQVMDKLGGWLRGQVALGAVIGVLYFVGFAIVGVPYALLLALLGGLLEFIPYIGPFIAAVPAIILALSISPTKAVLAMVVMIIIQQLENNVIVPMIMSKAVGMNPIVSIVAFMIGAQLFGVVGAIFAIPVALAGSVVLSEILRMRKPKSLTRHAA